VSSNLTLSAKLLNDDPLLRAVCLLGDRRDLKRATRSSQYWKVAMNIPQAPYAWRKSVDICSGLAGQSDRRIRGSKRGAKMRPSLLC